MDGFRFTPPWEAPAAVDGSAAAVSNGSPLRAMLDAVVAERACSLRDLTVLAPQNDPFRVDTPARHRDGEWLAITARELGLGYRHIHLRGLHYMVIGRLKPDGLPYTNTDKDWLWLSGDAGKAARWLRYIPFGQIVDQRNAPPEIREFTRPAPGAYLSTELDIEIPYNIEPALYTHDFRGAQPYKTVMFGEKSSLNDVLSPLAEAYDADLYLPTGEISDTLLHHMASVAERDGRPMAVLCFSDCDPVGWQMPVSIARKLQAFRVLLPAMPDFAVYRVALTPEQVGEYGLPSTPLKETERRADKWRQATGVQQTEIDALASLRPDLLETVARQALDKFYDHTLAARVARYRVEWLDRAQHLIEATFDTDRLGEIRRDAEQQLDGMREQIRQLSDALRIDVDDEDLPPIEIPGAIDPGGNGLPLLDSRWEFAEQCRRLKASKAYDEDGR
jgi:hypothetical protein